VTEPSSGPTPEALDAAQAAIVGFNWSNFGLDEVGLARSLKWAEALAQDVAAAVWPLARAQMLTHITGVRPGDPPPWDKRPDTRWEIAARMLPALAQELRETATIMDYWGGEEYRQFANAIDRILAHWARGKAEGSEVD
jgi:hypothetical protein